MEKDLQTDEWTKYLKANSTPDEQHIFIKHFNIYLQYGTEGNEFVIDFDEIWKWVGFSRKSNAKRHLMKNYETNIDFIIQNKEKEIIMLTVETFKAFCMTANTKQGKQTRMFYTKMESMFFSYMEIKNKDLIETLLSEEKNMLAQARHNHLIEIYKSTPCVYIIKIEETDIENCIIKLGETDDIVQRISSLRQQYRDCILQDVFPCNRPHKFEQYLLNRPDIKSHRIHGTELISISANFTYQHLVKIIKKHIDFFDNIPHDQKLKMSKNKRIEAQMNEKIQMIQFLSSLKDDASRQQFMDSFAKITVPNQETDDDLIDSPEVTSPVQSNRRVYKYKPDDLINPINTYFSLSEAARSLDSKIHDYHIRSACLENTLCQNYRWYFVDNDETLPVNIPPTKKEKKIEPRRKGLVAQLNLDENAIISVFPNQKEAAAAFNLASCSLTIAITKKSLAGNYYWRMYDECEESLKSAYKGEIPKPKLSETCSKKVERLDPETNEVLETYACIQDVCSKHRICHKTVNKISASGDIYKGFKWRLQANS